MRRVILEVESIMYLKYDNISNETRTRFVRDLYDLHVVLSYHGTALVREVPYKMS